MQGAAPPAVPSFLRGRAMRISMVADEGAPGRPAPMVCAICHRSSLRQLARKHTVRPVSGLAFHFALRQGWQRLR